MARALIHLHRTSNLGSALPFAHALKHSGPWDLALSVTPRDPERHLGLSETALVRLRKLGIPIVDHPRDWKPQVTFTFDPVESTLEDGGLLVRVPSGIRGAGRRYTNRSSGNLDNLADLILLPGEWHRKRLQAGGQLFAPMQVTGLPSLDPLLGNWLPPREAFCQQLRIDPSKKVILYAPTVEMELSAVPILWTRIRELVDENNLLMIRLHPDSPEEVIHAHNELATNHPNVMIAREPDLQPYLRIASLVISDVSSVAFEAAALEIPVVLFDNPNQREYPDYDADDPEYAFRDFFPRAHDLPTLKRTVREVLAHPGNANKASQQVRTHLITAFDGSATRNVIQTTAKLLQDRQHGKSSMPSATALIPVETNDARNLQDTLESLFDHGGMPVKVVLALPEQGLDKLDTLMNRWPGKIRTVALHHLAEMEQETVGSVFTVLIHPGVTGGSRWVIRLINHLRRHGELQGIVPLIPGGAPAQDPRILLQIHLPAGSSPTDLDRLLRTEHAGVTLRAVTTPRLEAAALRTGSAVWQAALRNLSLGRTEGAHTSIGVAADVVMEHPAWSRPPVWERSAPLTRSEIIATERRIRELSDWVGRIIPDNLRRQASESPHSLGSRPSNGTTRDGRLRLVLHYEKSGDRESAIRHLRSFMADHPEDPDAQDAARRLGIETEPVN